MKRKICITAAMVAVFFAVLWHMPEPAPVEPDPQVQALQTEVSQLREQGERIEALAQGIYDQQSYEIMQRDWRGGK
jgi:regulator of sirC expression with transglutaminase-like and TPR domain